MRPGRHGSMSSGELESIIARNGEFITVRRAGSGENGYAGVYNSVTCEYILPIHNGMMPEYSRMQNAARNCECTPKGECRTGAHGTNLKKGWRNCLYELLSRGRVRTTAEIRRVLGDFEAYQARDYGMRTYPQTDPHGRFEYSGVRT